jgi:choline dehydrogenase-like flavoprotein
VNQQFDIVIIGTGAGGGTMAQALSDASARILVLERGDFVPQEAENWDPEAVWKYLRYRSDEVWLDRRGVAFRPYTHYNVGGNTKFWGSVLYRLRREDFQDVQLADGVSPAWPIDYDTLEPYYERAERLYHVRGKDGFDPTEPPRASPFPHEPVPHAPGMAALAPVAAAARPAQARRNGRLRALQHVQLVRMQGSREERGGRLLRAARRRASERDAVDQRVRAPPDDGCVRAED